MSAPAASSALVAVLFAKEQTLSSVEWQKIFALILDKSRVAFGKGANINVASETPPISNDFRFRFLDHPTTTNENPQGRVVEFTFEVTQLPTLQTCKAFTDSEALRAILAQYHSVEIVLQPEDLHRSHRLPAITPTGVTTPRLAVFDMDSTLIQQEVIDELARAVGLYTQVSAITEAAMRGEEPYTDFYASLRARVKLLGGVPLSIWQQLREEVITFTPGVRDLIRVLKAHGWTTAVLSGGFTDLASWVQAELGLDYMFANQLVRDEQKKVLTGELVPGALVVTGEAKRELLLQIAKERNIQPQHIIAVGDGSNDLPMMGVAGLGIAFNAKPKVQLAAPSKLNGTSLLDVAYVLGFTSDEIDSALNTRA